MLKMIAFVTFVPEVYIQKQLLKTIYMSMYMVSIPVQTKVQFKILQLFVVTFDMSCLRPAVH